jgi:hypothetical protein
MRNWINLFESHILTETESLPIDDDARLSRARAMGFNTDVVVYHGSQADAFDAFSKDHLGTYTGSASAKLGFYFGSSRDNSTSYSGGDPEKSSFKNLPALKALQTEIMDRCKQEKIPRSFSMGLQSATAVPRYAPINDTATSTDQIKDILISTAKTQFETGVAAAKDYLEQYNAGKLKPKRDYSDAKFINSQVLMMKRQYEIAIQVITDWSEPLVMKDWGWLGAFYLRMGKTYEVDQASGKRQQSFVDIVSQAKAEGYDSVIIYNTFDPKPTDVYVVFEPNQIRSVLATFDPSHAGDATLMA